MCSHVGDIVCVVVHVYGYIYVCPNMCVWCDVCTYTFMYMVLCVFVRSVVYVCGFVCCVVSRVYGRVYTCTVLYVCV